MIAASEPLEFVPHGRIVAENHPKKIYNTKCSRSRLSENSLLYKLTNFGIKDDSLLEGAVLDEKEWWCVREVYARKNEDFEDDTPTPKETKGEFTESSESFRPPSRLKNDFNISIKSELMAGVKKMETDCVGPAQGNSRGGSANSSSNMSKKFNFNSSHNKSPNEEKPFNPKTDSCYEEELYVKGCTAVWSKGLFSTPATRLSNPESRETIACYTLENTIKHAIFCNFHVSINNTMLIDALNTQIGDLKKNIKIEDTTEHLETKNMPSILLVDNKNVRVYAADGREYVTCTPFQVRKVWPMKYGVLFEKDATPLIHNSLIPLSFLKFNESQSSTFSKSKSQFLNMSAKLRQESMSTYDPDVALPTCFSMSHPLDEVTPLLMKSPSHGLQYYNDGDLQIIFVSTSPSIILIYDSKLGLHSLWTIRKALREECLLMCPNVNSTTVFSQSCEFPGSPMNSNFKNATSWATGLGSPYPSRKGSATPNRSKMNSPMANAFHQQGLSPHGSIGQASSLSMIPPMNQSPPSLPLYPDICLDHIWTDSRTIRRDPTDNAAELKSFLHTDLVGHNYLCFMIKADGASRLQIVRLQSSHGSTHRKTSKKIIVGSVNSVAAKDAVVLEHLMMMALIDESGNIILQSGTSVVGKVHVGGVLARLLDSPYSRRAALRSPFPRRSSLLPARAPDAASFDDSALHLLSPVPHSSAARLDHKDSLGLKALCDAVGSRLTLVFDNSTMYRITLPDVSCSTQIAKCCDALKAILPKDVTMQVLTKWYGTRNAPGSQDLTPEQEWSMFANLLFSLIGYDLEKLSLPRRPEDSAETAEVASKKQRTSGDGTQDDWDYMLSSKLHKNYGNSLANLLNLSLPKSESKPKCQGRKKSNAEDKSAQFNSNALLFPYTAHVLYALHLVYEDTKLNTLLLNELPPLSKFLHQIAKDLRLEKYVTHYWLDFPLESNLEIDDHESQMTENHLQKLIQPSYVTTEPPNLFAYVNAMFKDVDVGYYPHLPDVNNMSRDIIEILSEVGCGRCGGVTSLCAPHASTPRVPSQGLSRADSCARALTLMADRGITDRDIECLPAALRLQTLCIVSACRASPPPRCCHLALRADLTALCRRRRRRRRTTEVANERRVLSDLKRQPPPINNCNTGGITGASPTFLREEENQDESSELKEKETAYTLCRTSELEPVVVKGDDKDADIKTGMEHLDTKLLRLLYPKDHRMTEVCNLLQSSIPVTINLTQRPDVSDHDFIEEQEKYLFAVSSRTMALPIARGMVTLRTCEWSGGGAGPGATAAPLCVSGRAGARRAAVTLPGEAPAWPAFHSGAAAGLALAPPPPPATHVHAHAHKQGSVEMSNEHAGFLLALGLNGQLKDMPFMNMYEYLVKCQEMISVGLLLGLAATYRGTMDVQATKMMSIHLEPLLPHTWVELDVQQHILVAALLGAGLLHQGSAHAHLAHKLLAEIGKPPGQDSENCLEREGYSLAAGLALGFVCVGAGSQLPGYIPNTLRTYMLGGDPPPANGHTRDGQTRGGVGVGGGGTETCANVDVTSPGASLALGLLYLGSGHVAVGAWLAPPPTAYLLDSVRPHLLMLRCIARGLIMWNSVEPEGAWVEAQVPETIKPFCFIKPIEDNIDYEAMNQAYCNIVAGACFTIGLRFAGSGNEDAKETLLYYTNLFLTLSTKSLGELAGKSTLESCLCVCLLAAGMVMSGRGDIEILRVCRRLRSRPPDVPTTAVPFCGSHGSQMAIHMTIGLLFLGGGRCTLSNSRCAVAALLTAFFPKFPTHTEDNRYHLQAFRHLYVLAVEARLLLPRDLSTGKLCYAHIQVVDLSGAVKEMKAPCILPELNTLKEVRINESRYWPIVFTRDTNWELLEDYLSETWCLDIKPRAGCLSYLDDPQGFKTLLAQTLTLDKANIWSAFLENIEIFTSDEEVRSFTRHYLSSLKDAKANVGSNVCADCMVLDKKKKKGRSETLVSKQCQCRKYCKEELEFVQALSMVTYECVVKDVLCALPVWTSILKIIKSMQSDPSTYHIWQIKLLLSQIEFHTRRAQSDMTTDEEVAHDDPLISTEYTLSISQRVCDIFDSFEAKIHPYLRKYLGLPSSRKICNAEDQMKKILTSYLVYHDIPKGALRGVNCDNPLAVLLQLDSLNLQVNAVSKIESLL